MYEENAAVGQRSWPAPAKLNLFLHVLGRRNDGYHELQTVFRFLEYNDELMFETRRDGKVTRQGNDEIPATDDLCVRAARLLQNVTGTSLGSHIRVTKRIPIGGGLGGGSSDAATTLIALNRIWRLGLTTAELMELGLRLGADVPVFVGGRTAWAEGVGERLSPLTLADQWYLVLVPPVSVSTARIFSGYKLTPDSRPITIRDFLAGMGRNDLESVVGEMYPKVGSSLRWLGQYGAARMTGTGSSVFLPVDGAEHGRLILAKRPPECRGFVARGVDFHPLLEA
jgi:4-diphosphocytidyl-2-C-methyl-D-erythritol kinase